MKTLTSGLALVALACWAVLFAQAGKLSDQEFRKVAASFKRATR